MSNEGKIVINEKLFEKAIRVIFQKMFHEQVNEEITNFFKNLSYVSIGISIEYAVVFVFNVLAGRILGPTEYGKFTLISSVAIFLQIPMLFGISTAMMKYNAEKKIFERQKIIISTSYILVLTFTTISAIVYSLFSSKIAETFSISKSFLYSSIFFAMLLAFYTFTTNILRSLHEMKMYSFSRTLYSIILVIFFIIFIIADYISVNTMIFSTYIGYLVSGLFVTVKIYKYISTKFNVSWAKNLVKYGGFSILNSTSSVLYTNIDKILINKYMLAEDLGIYNAYRLSSISVLSIFSTILIAVLFPTISKYTDKSGVIDKFLMIAPYFIVLGIPAVSFIEYFTLKIYGENYPIDFSLILLFSITSLLFVFFDTYAWIFNSVGIKGVKLTSYGYISTAIVNILLNIKLIPNFGLHGATIAATIAYLIGIFFIHFGGRKLQKSEFKEN